MDNKELDEFINNILEDKKLSGVTDEVRAQLVIDMRERLLDQINRALIDAMPDDKIDELDALLDRNAPAEETQRLIAESGIDVREVVASTMIKFRNLYIGATESR